MSKESIKLKEYIRIPHPETVNYDGTTYVRQGRSPRIGVLVAIDKDRWGWSIISPLEPLTKKVVIPKGKLIVENGKKIFKATSMTSVEKRIPAEEVWEMGTFIALDRAMNPELTPEIIPTVAKASINRFKLRMARYFK